MGGFEKMGLGESGEKGCMHTDLEKGGDGGREGGREGGERSGGWAGGGGRGEEG